MKQMNRGPYQRSAVLAALAMVGAVAVAACAGPATPQVASLGRTGASTAAAPTGAGPTPGSSPTPPPSGDATKLLDEWTSCIQGQGDPNQSVPTIDQYGDIDIRIPVANNDLSKGVHDLTAPCSNYLSAASSALRNGQPMPSPPSQATEVKYSQCMRANGIPSYPDPEPNGDTNFNGTGVDPTSPQFKSVNDLCSAKLGIPSLDTPPAGFVSVQSGPTDGPPRGDPTPAGGTPENGAPGPNDGNS
ncbi:MAG: hypothetical protein ACRDJU_05225 [Actinomycetota bacterium]